MGTWIVGLIVLLLVGFAARSLWKNHKAGNSTCASCPSSTACPHASTGCGSHSKKVVKTSK